MLYARFLPRKISPGSAFQPARQRVVRVVALVVGQQVGRARQVLVAGAPGARLADGRFQEEVFGEVIGEARAVDDVALEVLDAEHADVSADLEVLGVDARAADLAALDLRAR